MLTNRDILMRCSNENTAVSKYSGVGVGGG